jgi:hypothetical protein
MKKILLASLLFISSLVFAQAPQGISYQAVAFNTPGNPVVNGNVGVRISILNNAADGTVIYSETHTKTTNAQGLFNLNIGLGTAVTGSFSTINWGGGSKFFKVEVDPAGGTNYTITGTNQLMSVPYALYAENINTNSLAGVGTSAFKDSSFAITDNMAVHVFSNGSWYTKTCSDYVSDNDVIGANGNFAVIDDTNVHVFSNGTWSTKNCSDYVSTDDVIASEGNFIVIDDTNVHAFRNGTWVTKNCSDYVSTGDVAATKGLFAVIDNTSVHVFSNGVWVTKICSDYVSSNDLISGEGRFIVIDNMSAHAFSNGTWVTKNCSDYISTGSVKVSTTN